MNIQLTLLCFMLSFILCGCGGIQEALNKGISMKLNCGEPKTEKTVKIVPCAVCKNNREIVDNLIDKIIEKQPLENQQTVTKIDASTSTDDTFVPSNKEQNSDLGDNNIYDELD